MEAPKRRGAGASRNKNLRAFIVKITERRGDFLATVTHGRRIIHRPFKTEGAARKWGEKERERLKDEYLGPILSGQAIKAQIEKRSMTLSMAAQLCNISLNTINNYINGTTKARRSTIQPLFDIGKKAAPRTVRQISMAQRAKEAAEIAESVRGRMHTFPESWRDDIEGMLIRLDAQVEAWEGKKKQPKGSEVAA